VLGTVAFLHIYSIWDLSRPSQTPLCSGTVDTFYLLLYVDDIVLTASSPAHHSGFAAVLYEGSWQASSLPRYARIALWL